MLRLPLSRVQVLQRPIQDCYAYLADFSTTEQWDPGVLRADKLTLGVPRAGTRFALQLNVMGRAVPAAYELRECAPGRELLLAGEGVGFRVIDHLRLDALGPAQTRLHYTADMSLSKLGGWLGPMLRPWGERLGDLAMSGLRRALEEDGPERSDSTPTLAERLVLPAMLDFTQRGYRRQHSRGLSRRLDGRTVAITGATAGLGLAAAQLLGRLGARLLLIGRGAGRLEVAAQAVRDFAGPVEIRCIEAELSLLREAHRLVDRVLADEPQLDVWINNAGALFAERQDTTEGHERSLAINLLTPALLSQRLAPALRARAGRLINVVSGGLYLQALSPGDLDSRHGRYDGTRAYARAKRGLLALTQRWAAQEHKSGGLSWQAVHPGWAATPGVEQSLPQFERFMRSRLRSARMGADSMAWLASHPAISDSEWQGRFWFDRAPRPAAVVPGTAVSAADAERLESWVNARIEAAR